MACDRNTYKQYTYTSEVRTFNGSDRLNIWYIDAINKWLCVFGVRNILFEKKNTFI